MNVPAILTTAIFVVCLILIFTDRLNRTIAAMIGAIIIAREREN